MVTTGREIPVVADTLYLSNSKEIRLYLNESIENYVSLSPYNITSMGVKDTEGGEVSFSEQVYFNPENDCELYDISIANVWFKSGDATYYVQPTTGPCDVYLRIVNSSAQEKNATLRISAGSRILKEEIVTLAANTEITKSFKGLSFFEGEKIEILLVK